MVTSMIVTMALCALWGMPPGKAVACGWALYFCAWSVESAMTKCTLHPDLAPYDRTTIALGSGRFIPSGALSYTDRVRNEKL